MLSVLEKLRRPRRMRVVCNGNPALRKKSEPIPEITGEIRELAERMIITMLEGENVGVGLAAPQVGINKRLIVIHTCGEGGHSRPGATAGELMLDPMMPVALVNPEIISSSEETECEEEGCLSLPGVSGSVRRPARVLLKATTLDGSNILVECGGLLGRCLQHEIDHLDGVLFYDHLSATEQRRNAVVMKKLEKQEQHRLSHK